LKIIIISIAANGTDVKHFEPPMGTGV